MKEHELNGEEDGAEVTACAQIDSSEFEGHHPFQTEDDLEYGPFEVYWLEEWEGDSEIFGEYLPAGWYWFACFPGCLPDGDPWGPFNTSQEAYENAREDC